MSPRFLPALNIRFPLQLPPFVWSLSSYTQSQTFHLITNKLTIQIWQITRSRHRSLKKTCPNGQDGFQIWRALSFVEWSILAGFPETWFLKIISPLSILAWGVPPSSLLESLPVLTQHKSEVGLWSMSDSFKTCSLIVVHFSDKKASDQRNSDSDGFLRTKLQATTANVLPT